MERKKSLKRNYLYNLSYQMLAILVPLITTPYISRVLGATKIGDFAYTSAIVSYFGIVAALGTASYAQREIAFHQKERQERSRIFYEILLFRGIMVGIVLIAYSIFLAREGAYRSLYLIQLCTVFSWAADISWFFQGMEDFKATVLRNALVKLVSVLLILLLVKRENDLWIYTLVICGTAFLGNMTLWPFLKQYIERVPLKGLRPFRHLHGSLELFVPVLSIQVYTVLDQTMLGAMINTTQVGYYAQSQKIVKLVSTVLYALTAVILPRMSVVLAEKKLEQANEYYRKVICFSMMLILPMMTGMIFLSDYLVPVFLGEKFAECVPLLKVFSLLLITQGIGQIGGTLLISLKKQKQYTTAVTAGAVVNLCCNFLLIPAFGAIGATIASVTAELCVEVLMLYYIRPEFHNGVLWTSFLNYLLPTVGMCAALTAVKYFLAVNLISLVLLTFLGMTVYGLLLLVRRDAFLWEQLKLKGK